MALMCNNWEQKKNNHQKLMERWAQEVREWVGSNVTFFSDGIVDPGTWEKETFRPLFILKETHETKDKNENPYSGKCINIVAQEKGEEYDIWNNRGGGMWNALRVLAQGMIDEDEGKIDSKDRYDELYAEDLDKYQETMKRIAIINVKKVAGGGTANSAESKQTICYECHAEKFKENIKEQIELIEPTVIICCGTYDCFRADIENDRLYGVPVVEGMHPARNCNRWRTKFYNETIKMVSEIMKKERRCCGD